MTTIHLLELSQQGGPCLHPRCDRGGIFSSTLTTMAFDHSSLRCFEACSCKLKQIKAELRRCMHLPIPVVGQWLRRILQGHYNYYGVPRNYRTMSTFRYEVSRLWFKTLRRRSQRSRLNWDRMSGLVKRWLPAPRIRHPYPEQRLRVFT